MTLQIALVLTILIVAVVLFVTERLRVDVVALLVLVTLALTGLVTPIQAVSGFSSPAVITVWAVFILSGALSKTGIAGLIGHHVLRFAGYGQVRLLVVIMLTAGVMSAFMNNVGVAALMLPVVIDITRRTGHSPSKLLMPLAFGTLLGGLNTLIGTPPNILISEILDNNNLRPFELFDYTPVGMAVMLAGITFMALVGRHLLPDRDITKELTSPGQTDLGKFYHLDEQLFSIRLPADSALAGKTLAESRLGSILGLNVIGIINNGQTRLSPNPDSRLQGGDKLLVAGQRDQLTKLKAQQYLTVEEDDLAVDKLASTEIEFAELTLAPQSPYVGQTLSQIDFRRRFEVNVLAILHNSHPKRTGLQNIPLQAEDTLLIQGLPSQIEALRAVPEFLVSNVKSAEIYRLHEQLLIFRVPANSAFVGKTLAQSRLGDAFGLTVLGIIRDGTPHMLPHASMQLMAGDALIVKGSRDDLLTLQGLQYLEIDQETSLELNDLESEEVSLTEVVLSPHTTLSGKSLRQLNFREKYGLNVLAIWREGQAHRTNLRDMSLRFGDALLLFGPRDKLMVLGSEPDFVVLTEEAQETPRLSKAPLAVLVMVGVLLPVMLGWVPIYISAIVGVILMILTGCLTMDEAYRYIEWKAVFLIAGMLPLGIAMQQSGAAHFLAEGMISVVGGFGPLAVVAGLFMLTALSAQVMPTPAVAVLLAPIALSTAGDLGMSPYALTMTVALSASASFLSPVAHPANILIMGPGGYRFTDYIKVGLPLVLVVLVVVLLVLPIFWPLYP